MPINNETIEIKICDLCGKQEGKQLSTKDFYQEAPIVSIKNHAGILMNFQLNVDCWPAEYDNEIEDTLNDVINVHDMFDQPQQTQPVVIIPYGVIAQTNQEELPPESLVCKGCFNTVVSMINSCGKFDTVENF